MDEFKSQMMNKFEMLGMVCYIIFLKAADVIFFHQENFSSKLVRSIDSLQLHLQMLVKILRLMMQ